MPSQAAAILEQDAEIRELAVEVAKARDVLFLGRGSLYPIALEGALKLKEISYIHAEGYAAGEMKHGPIALIDRRCAGDRAVPLRPAVREDRLQPAGSRRAWRPDHGLHGCGRRRAARALRRTGDRAAEGGRVLSPPILYAIPVQLLAYHVAVLKGTDVDQPRNLAKSVTVE